MRTCLRVCPVCPPAPALPLSRSVEPLALGEFGTLYVVGFALLTVSARLAMHSVNEWATNGGRVSAENMGVVQDVGLFLAARTFDLLKLMFASLSGRYIVNLFATAKEHSGYVLFIVVSAIVLLKLGEHAIRRDLGGQ